MIERILNDIEELKKRTTRPLVTAGINMVLEIIKKHSKNNGWIPCSERLPEKRVDVLVSFRGHGDIVIAWYSEINKQWKNSSTDNVIKAEVIAWQPLPEAHHG